MKRITLLLARFACIAAMLLACPAVMGQIEYEYNDVLESTSLTTQELKSILPGTWQLKLEGKYTMYIKTIQSDGSFYNHFTMPDSGKMVAVMKGTYTIKNGRYTEFVKESLNEEFAQNRTAISILARDEQTLYFAFEINGKRYLEEWCRVDFPKKE